MCVNLGCSTDQFSGDAGADGSADGQGSDASDAATMGEGGTADGSSGDGGLWVGADCDPKNDRCLPSLKCCPTGIGVVDAASLDKCIKPLDGGTCPIVGG